MTNLRSVAVIWDHTVLPVIRHKWTHPDQRANHYTTPPPPGGGEGRGHLSDAGCELKRTYAVCAFSLSGTSKCRPTVQYVYYLHQFCSQCSGSSQTLLVPRIELYVGQACMRRVTEGVCDCGKQLGEVWSGRITDKQFVYELSWPRSSPTNIHVQHNGIRPIPLCGPALHAVSLGLGGVFRIYTLGG